MIKENMTSVELTHSCRCYMYVLGCATFKAVIGQSLKRERSSTVRSPHIFLEGMLTEK